MYWKFLNASEVSDDAAESCISLATLRKIYPKDNKDEFMTALLRAQSASVENFFEKLRGGSGIEFAKPRLPLFMCSPKANEKDWTLGSQQRSYCGQPRWPTPGANKPTTEYDQYSCTPGFSAQIMIDVQRLGACLQVESSENADPSDEPYIVAAAKLAPLFSSKVVLPMSSNAQWRTE